MSQNPYKYASDEVLLNLHIQRNEATTIQEFFSKVQACFRCSPLAKSYGWGFHFNEDGKVTLYAMESTEYQQLVDDGDVENKPAFSVKG